MQTVHLGPLYYLRAAILTYPRTRSMLVDRLFDTSAEVRFGVKVWVRVSTVSRFKYVVNEAKRRETITHEYFGAWTRFSPFLTHSYVCARPQ